MLFNQKSSIEMVFPDHGSRLFQIEFIPELRTVSIRILSASSGALEDLNGIDLPQVAPIPLHGDNEEILGLRERNLFQEGNSSIRLMLLSIKLLEVNV